MSAPITRALGRKRVRSRIYRDCGSPEVFSDSVENSAAERKPCTKRKGGSLTLAAPNFPPIYIIIMNIYNNDFVAVSFLTCMGFFLPFMLLFMSLVKTFLKIKKLFVYLQVV